MKDFRSVLSDYLNKHDRHRKQFAAVVSLSMLVSFSVPMILTEPAVSMTQDSFSPVGDILSAQLFNASQAMVENYAKENGNEVDGVVYSPKELAEGELLIGKGSDLYADSADAVIANAKREYFLGIASDFCIFLKTDFTPKAADAEGRVAVGGNVKYESNDGNYQIGAGDYISGTALKNTDNYEKASGFAQLIVGGSISQIAPYGTKHDDSGFSLASPEEDLYKRFVVSNKFNYDDSLHIANVKWNNGPVADLVKYDNTDGHNHYYNSYDDKFNATDEKAQIYQTTSENPLIDFDAQFKWLNEQSSKLSKVKSIVGELDNGILTFTAPDEIKEGDVVYFEIPEEWTDNKYEEIHYVNIPVDEGNVPLCNIVVNCKGETFNIGKNAGNGSGTIKTIINGTEISTGQIAKNNHKASEKILYNFYQAIGECTFGCNFNGTILAPNADVKTKCDGPNDGAGHLSGALIANSYEGGMEFGYRPYRGPSSIVPSSSGYGVPIRKVISGSNTGLAGATFEITDGDEYSNTFTSDANGDGYVNIPSQVDFSGETTYNSSNNVITKTYTIHETIAPTGFVKDDTTTYEITVTETIDINSMHKNADGTEIPSKVLTQVTSNGESFTIELEDIYDEVSGERTKRELTIGDEIYVIDIDKGDATNVYKRAKDSKDTSVTVLSSSGTLFTTVIETSGMSTMTEENGDVKTTNLVTEKVEKDFDYNISAVACTPNSANVDAELILYYKDDTKETIDISTNAFNWNTSEDGSFNEYWGQNNIEKKDVIGFDVNIKSIEKDFELYIKGSSDNGDFDWSNDIFSRTFNKDEFDNENGFTYSFGRQELPTDESERYEDKVVSYDVVTTDAIFSTEVNTYLTETWTKAIGIYDTEAIAAFNENGYKSPTTFTTVVGSDNYEYKYDPETLMIMPQPLNTPTFENDYGLIFAKVDDEGKSVPGATIEVQHHYYDFDDNKWKWVPIADGNNILDGGSLTTIDLKEIKDEEKWGSGWNYVHQRKVYRFVETDTPAGYEIAVPIYFVKDDNTIYYKSSETEIESMPLDETDWTGWQSVDLTKNNTADRKAVEMVDIKISGAKIKLAKYDSDFKNTLEGATFKLYAGNGDLIYPLSGTFTIDDESLDLYAMLRSAKETEYDTKYVQNGYLKPGSYYLEEITAPDGYDAQGKFGFRVKSDYSIEAVDAGTPSYFNTTVGSGKEVWIYPQNAEGEKISVSNVTKIEIELNSPTSGKLALWEGPFKGANPTITDGTVVLDNLDNVSFEGFKIQNQNYNDGVDVKEVRIYGEEGSGDSTSRAYNLTQIAWNGGNISKINKLTLYYADGTNASKENVSWSGNSDWAMFDLNGLILNNVVGLTVDFEGTAKIFVQDNTWENILGSGVEASGTCSFGNTNVNTGNETTDSELTEPEEETEDLAVKVSGDTIKIPNKKSGDKITITVEKKWVNDDGFESLRPESIEVQLKRKKSNGSEDDEFNSDNTYKATLDGSNDWKKSWSGLDRYDGDETQLYTYYVAEINVNDNYTVSYDANSDGKNDTLTSGGTLKITNTLNTIDINIEKKWDKNGCDDAVIPNSIEVKVQFKKADDDDSKWADVMKPVETTNEDGEILSSQEVLTLKLTEKDNWSGEVKNLPDIYEYRFVEMNVPTGWESDNSDTAKKDDLSASITNTLMTGSLGVEKNWANDSAADRPENLTISLYRTTKAPTTDTSESTETYEDITVTEGETIVLNTGDEGRLVLDSDKTVEWNDTENDKVKVENGILTVLDEGITTVSATIDDTPTIFNVNVKIASVVPNVTGMQKVKDIETFVKSDKAWNADVTDLPLYSPDGKPYYYYIVEKYTGADGKTVTGNNCTYYSVNYSDAVTLIDNPSTSPTLSVTNEKVDTEGITLPEAGGSGTHNYYIAGICLIGMAGIFWVIRRRRTTK